MAEATLQDCIQLLLPKEKAKQDHGNHWLDQFRAYWKDQISPQNYRTILRQVEKLARGQGISYHHWPADVCFAKDMPIDMMFV